MATITSVKAKIKTLLETKEGTGEPLNEVYGYIEVEPRLYPCALVEYLEHIELRLDDATNELTVKYLVKVLINDANDLTTSTTRMGLIQELTDMFRSYVDTLDGIVTRFDVESVKAFNSSEDVPYSGFDIVLSTYFISPI